MRCPRSGCGFDTAAEIEDAADVSNHVKLLEVHCVYAHPGATAHAGGTGQLASRTARIQQPKIIVTDGTVLEEDWEFFLHSWSEYKTLASPGTQAKEILGNVLGEIAAGVFSRLGKAGYEGLTEADLLVHAKKLVVKERNLLVSRLKLATIIQDEDEPVYKFETRLKPIARIGKFQQKCERCDIEVDFTEQMVRDHLIRGLSDLEIKKKVLALEWKQCTLEKVLSLSKQRNLGNGVFQIPKCSVMQTQSQVIRNKMESFQTKISPGRCAGSVVAVSPIPQIVLKRTNRVITAGNLIMCESFANNSRRRIRTKGTQMMERLRLFRSLVCVAQSLQYATARIKPRRLGYQSPHLRGD